MEATKLPTVGIFGTGLTSRIHLHLLKHHGFQINAVWDTNKMEADKMAQEYEVPFSSDKIDDVLLKVFSYFVKFYKAYDFNFHYCWWMHIKIYV